MSMSPADGGQFQRDQDLRLVMAQETVKGWQVRDAMKCLGCRCSTQRHQPFRRTDPLGQRRDVAEESLHDLRRDCGLIRHALLPSRQSGTKQNPFCRILREANPNRVQMLAVKRLKWKIFPEKTCKFS